MWISRRILTLCFIALTVVFVVVALSQTYTIRAQRQLTHKLETEVDQRIVANREAIQRETTLRRDFSHSINQFVYDQCVLGETRDVIIVAQLQAAKRRARASLPTGSPVLLQALASLDDGINALEPEDEQDCSPTTADRPEKP